MQVLGHPAFEEKLKSDLVHDNCKAQHTSNDDANFVVKKEPNGKCANHRSKDARKKLQHDRLQLASQTLNRRSVLGDPSRNPNEHRGTEMA